MSTLDHERACMEVKMPHEWNKKWIICQRVTPAGLFYYKGESGEVTCSKGLLFLPLKMEFKTVQF